uniref:Uncharacterized protein n=1 Tax=Tetraselmis sp. GSL018 TaxID=582737 RepID=A0A061S409_9CHLO
MQKYHRYKLKVKSFKNRHGFLAVDKNLISLQDKENIKYSFKRVYSAECYQ